MIFGAAIAFKIHNPVLAVVLAFLSHYVLDFIPHIEYDWKKSYFSFLKVILDFFIGILLISIFSDLRPVVFIASFFAILPDGLSLLNFHKKFHQEKIHYFRDKKISNFWRIFFQVLMALGALFFLFF